MRRWCSTVVHSIAMCGFEKVASSILHQCKCGPGPSERERKSRERRCCVSNSPHSSVFCARVLNVKVSFWSGPSREVSDSGNSQRGHLPPLQTPYSCGRQQAPILGKAKVGACTGVLIEPGDVRDIVAIRTI